MKLKLITTLRGTVRKKYNSHDIVVASASGRMKGNIYFILESQLTEHELWPLNDIDEWLLCLPARKLLHLQ